MINITPAIDIIGGKCVRPTQGDYSTKKIYSANPLEVARSFEDHGIKNLHLVDLDGAKTGKVANQKVLEDIATGTNLHIDFGGGITTTADIESLINAGARQMNIGSLAVKDPECFIEWIKVYGDKIILSADVNGESIAVRGWQEASEINLFTMVSGLLQHGIKYVTCTDIATDGMLQGPSFALYEKLRAEFKTLYITASGGIHKINDIHQLNLMNIDNVIVGKAIYEGHIPLSELAELLK